MEQEIIANYSNVVLQSDRIYGAHLTTIDITATSLSAYKIYGFMNYYGRDTIIHEAINNYEQIETIEKSIEYLKTQNDDAMGTYSYYV